MYSNTLTNLENKIIHSFAKLKKKKGILVQTEDLQEEDLNDTQSESEDGTPDVEDGSLDGLIKTGKSNRKHCVNFSKYGNR